MNPGAAGKNDTALGRLGWMGSAARLPDPYKGPPTPGCPRLLQELGQLQAGQQSAASGTPEHHRHLSHSAHLEVCLVLMVRDTVWFALHRACVF